VRVAHLADLHLGFRQFHRTTPRGGNQREADVADALRRAVDDLIAQRPDLVVIAGDVFHSVRPPNGAILFCFQQLQRLRTALPETRVVIVAGNHDTPRTSDAGVILPLYQALGVDVVVGGVARISLPAHRCMVTAVPSSAAAQPLPAPDPAAAVNVLVLHADVIGYDLSSRTTFGRDHLDASGLAAAGWDYVALGDYHVAAQVAPRVWYSGATERTSTDPWRELRVERERGLPGKGWLLVELPGGAPVFRPIAAARPFLDLEPVDAAGLGAEDLGRALAARVEGVALDGAVVRLVVTNVTRDLRRALDYGPVRGWKARALHFQLDLRRADEEATPAARAARFQPLDQLVAEFLGARTLPPDLDRETFVALGVGYLRTAGAEPLASEPAA